MTAAHDPAHDPIARLAPRQAEAHKGTFGTALVVGGSLGMTGAVGLAGMAALRGGAGLVRLAVADVCLATVAAYEPSYMTVALPSDRRGRISLRAFDQIERLAASATAVACGPGLARSPGLDALVGRLYRSLPQPMIVDADALNALSARPESLDAPGGPRILTPHPGEFARLAGAKLEGDRRRELAVELARRWRAVLILKGHRTLVTDGQRQTLNTTGNPGMASGGSGDVLTGLLAALACQGLAPFDAARLAVYLHGLAGDLAAQELGQVSMIATDLLRHLPRAIAAQGTG